VPGPQGSGTAIIVPYQAFTTADGSLMIAAGTDTLFARLCRALGRPDLADDPRFADNAGRIRHRDALLPALEAATRTVPTTALLERLRAADVPCAPIQALDAVAADPQTKASEMLAPTPHPEIPDLLTVALPVRWDGARPVPLRPPPRLGEHTGEILAELGLAPAEIEALRARGTVHG
jgi:crotonobetainyl-CoA:carnitine CoA-transferase CaiB-like acyl-CoA transferase